MLIDINLMAKEQRAIGWKWCASKGISWRHIVDIKHTNSHMRQIIVNCDFCRIVLFTGSKTPAYPLMSIESEDKKHFLLKSPLKKGRNGSDKYINEHFPLNSL